MSSEIKIDQWKLPQFWNSPKALAGLTDLIAPQKQEPCFFCKGHCKDHTAYFIDFSLCLHAENTFQSRFSRRTYCNRRWAGEYLCQCNLYTGKPGIEKIILRAGSRKCTIRIVAQNTLLDRQKQASKRSLPFTPPLSDAAPLPHRPFETELSGQDANHQSISMLSP